VSIKSKLNFGKFIEAMGDSPEMEFGFSESKESMSISQNTADVSSGSAHLENSIFIILNIKQVNVARVCAHEQFLVGKSL
jgi:hypothetical protein